MPARPAVQTACNFPP